MEYPYLKVVSDGTSMGTKLMMGDVWVRGVRSISIDEIKMDSLVTATITIEAGFDITLLPENITIKMPEEDNHG